MKTLLITIGLVLSYTASAQWVSKTVNNGFDDPYKIAYTDVAKDQWLKLENYNNEISFYIGGVYICDGIVSVDMSFLVSGVYQKYTIEECYTSDDSGTVFFVDNLTTHEMLSSFKSASSVKVRINDTSCDSEVYEFKMSGSTAAYNFVVAP
jgi:hypothetical protein